MRRSPCPPSGQTARPPEIRRARCLLMRGRPPGLGPQTGPHLRRAGADRASYSPVIGAWRPLAGTAPYLGRMGEVCHAPELKVEVTCRTDRVEETVAAVKRAHPYEEPVINVIPLYRTGL